ncbi:MAG: CBS domain-containing protein [Proteobacteria bacterium]|nr:CBS domain-containing protein [Pseudomonadota bacterium]
MKVEHLMSSPATTCNANDTLETAAGLMWDHDCGALPVVREEDGKLTGMITDRDICMAGYTQGRPLGDLLVNSAMATHVVAVKPDQGIAELEQLMIKHQLRRLPVVDRDGKPIGMISLGDLARESALPSTRMTNAMPSVARTLAAIATPRHEVVSAPVVAVTEPARRPIEAPREKTGVQART